MPARSVKQQLDLDAKVWGNKPRSSLVRIVNNCDVAHVEVQKRPEDLHLPSVSAYFTPRKILTKFELELVGWLTL